MAEEKREPWLNQMAFATVIFAVCATLSAFKGSSYSTLSVISQTQASDQWAFYQSKSMKLHLFETLVEQLRLQALSIPRGEVAAAYVDKIALYQAEIKRYAEEKKQIEAKAKDLERQRDEAKRHNQPFGMAVIFLQVAILMTSIAGLMKTKKVWWAALPVGLTGLVFFADGFLALF